ncbi:MAG: pyridoxamine 5'-phosphate oxidase family protein [Methanomicrobiales archaeon]|nr:pyridoxamine 5'-phosphate oxidase family protein [Methanomicrobiales archaeon]
MVRRPEELVEMPEERHTVPIATAGEAGQPNVTPKYCMVRGEETRILNELCVRQTYENLKEASAPFRAANLQ